MKDLDFQNKVWLANHLALVEHGERGKIAAAVDVSSTQLSRMANIDPESPPKNTQNIPFPKLVAFAKYFNDVPPGIAAAQAKEAPPPPARKSREIARIPLLDRVPAGRLKGSISQMIREDTPHISISGLGTGEWFGLTVEGDSMDRVSPEGSIILVNSADRQLLNGKFYVFAHRGKMTYKMWQSGEPAHMAPYSTNPTNKPIFFKRKSDLEVLGRVRRTILEL